MRQEMLRFEHVSKSINREQLLSDVTFSVYRATFHCLLTPNPSSRACLLDLLRGVSAADSGTIYVSDNAVSSSELAKSGVNCILMQLNLIPQMSIATNIFLTDKRYYQHGFTRQKLMANIADQLLRESTIHNVEALHSADMLRTYDKHIVEIISAVSKGAHILCLDDIAEQYTEQEISDLWNFIKYLNELGVTVLMLTQKYNKLYEHAHSTTVLDKSSTVITLQAPHNNREQLLKYLQAPDLSIVGKQSTETPQRLLPEKTSCYNGKIRITQGEITGIYDADWSIAEALTAAFTDKYPQGIEIFINGKSVSINSTQEAIQNGIILINEQSASSQFFPNMSLERNITLKMGKPLYNRFGLRSHTVERYMARHTLQMLNCAYLLDDYGHLDNLPMLPWHEQIKIIIARWLCCKPQGFVFINPLLNYNDVTAYEFIKLADILKKHGYGVLVVSSSLNELRAITDNYR